MNMNFGLSLTQEQKLIMTQQMQLSIKLLQMSTYELQQYVEKEVQENPVLDSQNIHKEDKGIEDINYKKLIKHLEYNGNEYGSYSSYNKEEETSPFNFISNEKSLKEYLQEQIIELNENKYIKSICIYIIENIDDKGYLSVRDEEISEELKVPLHSIEEAIDIVQSLEPDGIGARNLKECLKIQLKKKSINNSKICEIIDNYLPLVAENRYNVISKKLGISIKKAQEYGDVIKTLQPKPSRGFYTGDEVKYIVPDAYIKKIDNEYYIIMNEELLPKLTVNNLYKDIVLNDTDENAVEFVKEKLNSAIFLIKSIENRKSTIYRVLEKILEIQRDYFDLGIKFLKPMTLKEIADSLGMHESTISRAIRDKYINTNRGTILIKNLFTTGITANNSTGEDISVEFIKREIKELIDKEDKKKPISDQIICNILNNKGIQISRRTVAKYREELGIQSSKCRKRF
ncbi:RNA polymerase factor sigma-54 [Clostridium botulinum]|uniref:RNA polymerase sigma-54 factor n=2 Tax=Clostridium botulinum TaxID=1491 RepID=A7G9X7_CLOBL|nr:RNA polymerase sigma-54 factor [Clostridium botulinum F str. Langeland]ADF98060.1 RNA polymerase sigma-54 factor [Clostridium botulinum F str. 230613]KKM41583.1 RNA polymerase sigma54 factor [Clostridium botulinum]NEZ51189.1 RNA polymerase factor sigma-54 [Clostridium botulinum F str. Langeland]NFF56639.1 RNA polymerase factor sigma-54 [Clostridium botulinum]